TIMDDYSRAICGYMVFEGAPSAMNTALALRQAIWPKSDPAWSMCGMPDALYVDHGSDFTSHHLEYTAIALKIRIIHSTVGRPQGRGKIERFFHTVNTEVLATLPGHLTPGHHHAVPTLELAGLDRAIGEFVGQYNERTHTAIRTSPKAAWSGEGWMPRMPESLEELDGLLLRVSKHRTVQPDGVRRRPGSAGGGCRAGPRASRSSTAAACESPSTARSSGTASISKDSATSHPRSPPSSGARSPSAMTLATSPRSVSTTTTPSCARRSMKPTPTSGTASMT